MAISDVFTPESFLDPENHAHDPLRSFRTHPYPWEPSNTDERTAIKNAYFKRYNIKPPKKTARLTPHFLDHDTEAKKEKYDPPPAPIISEKNEQLGSDGEWLKWGFIFLILSCAVGVLSFLCRWFVVGLLACLFGQRFEAWLKRDGEEEEGEWLMTDTWKGKKPKTEKQSIFKWAFYWLGWFGLAWISMLVSWLYF
jgi:hypothetical protein